MINKFLDYIKSKIGCGYVWGSQGQTLTPELLNYFKKSFGEKHYDFGTTHASKWLGNQCFDCSGLVVAALNELGLIKMDYTAAGLYGICKNLKKTELRAGDLVFCKGTSINHVGVYVGNGEVIEAKGTAYGVVKSKLVSIHAPA
ncbi:MAG TPA: hypothetical protein DIW31_08595 [Bacteroidales bacterium]|nr:hypothetical protein [Bacteroidales bacterium]